MTSLIELANQFDTKEKCLVFLERLRFPDGVQCPRCKSKRVCRLGTVDKLQCNDCRYMFSITAGTVFHRTHLPLNKWILATFLICNAKKGISAKQIQRDLNVSYKTAWYLMHRIRRAMKQPGFIKQFTGIVEADETYLGGKRRGKRGRGAAGKAIVIGVRQRKGKLRAELIPDVKAKTVCGVLRKYVRKDAEMLCVDELPSYNQLAIDYNLERIHHEIAYVRGMVHINGVESFWAILKRAFIGTHHKMSTKYLPLYLNEFTFRFNHNGETNLYQTVLTNALAVDGQRP